MINLSSFFRRRPETMEATKRDGKRGHENEGIMEEIDYR